MTFKSLMFVFMEKIFFLNLTHLSHLLISNNYVFFCSKRTSEDAAVLAPLFGPPLESAFEEDKLEGKLLNCIYVLEL